MRTRLSPASGQSGEAVNSARHPVCEHAPISVRVREAVRLTGLSRSTLYELMRAGEIEYVKVGGSTLILVASLRDFVEARRVER